MIRHLIAGAVLLNFSSAALAQTALPVSPEQTAEIGKRCKGEIDRLSEALGDGPSTIADYRGLLDVANNPDPRTINQSALTKANAELAAARRSGEQGAMVDMSAALVCVVKQRLDLARQAGYVPGPAASTPAPAQSALPECATLQAQFDRSQGERQRLRDERTSGRYLANKLAGDKLLMQLNDIRKSASKAGCPTDQTDAMKVEIKDIHWVIEHTTRF